MGPGGRDAYRDEPWTFTGRTAPELAGQPVHVVRGPFRISTPVATGTVGPGGAISLTHRMTDVGRYDYWLSVDGGLLMYGADSPHSSITTRAVGAPTTPSITTTSLPSVEVHVPYQATFLAAGGEVTWSAVGALPPGLTLSSDGVLTGTPSQAGTWEVGVRASNVAGTTTRTVSLTVAPGSLTVTTGRLYDAAVGVPYPHTPYTSGGWQEMFCTPCPGGATWAVTSGSLPPGMDFVDGDDIVDPPASYVYGTATQPGVYQFTIRRSWTGGRAASSSRCGWCPPPPTSSASTTTMSPSACPRGRWGSPTATSSRLAVAPASRGRRWAHRHRG